MNLLELNSKKTHYMKFADEDKINEKIIAGPLVRISIISHI